MKEKETPVCDGYEKAAWDAMNAERADFKKTLESFAEERRLSEIDITDGNGDGVRVTAICGNGANRTFMPAEVTGFKADYVADGARGYATVWKAVCGNGPRSYATAFGATSLFPGDWSRLKNRLLASRDAGAEGAYKLTPKQSSLVDEFVDLLDRMDDAGLGIALNEMNGEPLFFNAENVVDAGAVRPVEAGNVDLNRLRSANRSVGTLIPDGWGLKVETD